MEGDQSGLSLKGCQARRNPIQYQYRGTTGRVGELLGSAAVSLTVVSAAAAAACQRPPSHTIVPPLPTPPTVPNTGQDRQMGCLGSLPREHSRGDEYQPMEEETASLPSWSRDVCCTRPFHRRLVCLFGRRLFAASLIHCRGIIDQGQFSLFVQIKVNTNSLVGLRIHTLQALKESCFFVLFFSFILFHTCQESCWENHRD